MAPIENHGSIRVKSARRFYNLALATYFGNRATANADPPGNGDFAGNLLSVRRSRQKDAHGERCERRKQNGLCAALHEVAKRGLKKRKPAIARRARESVRSPVILFVPSAPQYTNASVIYCMS